ncbi:Uncharacterised protein [Yersinia kristensenii]|nr:Uncharacterised protein [Yersinia kristensenii]
MKCYVSLLSFLGSCRQVITEVFSFLNLDFC